MKVGSVDCDDHKDLAGKFGVQGFPTIKIFTGKDHQAFNGERTAKGIAEAGLAAAKKKVKAQLDGGSSSGSGSSSGGSKGDVIELTDSNFEKLVLESDDVWLVEFFAPWCKFSQIFQANFSDFHFPFKADTAKTSNQNGPRLLKISRARSSLELSIRQFTPRFLRNIKSRDIQRSNSSLAARKAAQVLMITTVVAQLLTSLHGPVTNTL